MQNTKDQAILERLQFKYGNVDFSALSVKELNRRIALVTMTKTPMKNEHKHSQVKVSAPSEAVRERLDRMFAPDIRVKLNESSRIDSAEAVTSNGASFMLRFPLLGVDYDTALFASNGLTFESQEAAQ